jgi:hypothetical protein
MFALQGRVYPDAVDQLLISSISSTILHGQRREFVLE